MCVFFFISKGFDTSIEPFLDYRFVNDLVQSLINQIEFFDVHVGPLSPIDPTKTCNIGNRHLIAHNPWSLRSRLRLLLQAVFEYLVEPLRLGLVAPDPVLILLRSITVEVIGLALSASQKTIARLCFIYRFPAFLHRT